jgi:thiamine kinase-like enzyme
LSEIEKLVGLVRAQLADDLRTGSAELSIEPILNWGGYVNRSFRISDGRSTRFLKLTSEREIQRGLARWRKNADRLALRYHAPPMLGWLDLGAYAGPIFEWIDGVTATRLDGEFGDDVYGVVRALHGDAELAERLGEDGSAVESCARAYLRSYHERFVEDLAFIDSDPPPFVGTALRAWMREQAGLLEGMVSESLAFQEPADAPVHADLWLNNMLIAATGHWYLLDWDGLTLGDPVLDWSMLFGPRRAEPREPDVAAVTARLNLTPAQEERLHVYARAALLDWIIDPLSDWVGSAQEPEHGEQMRAANEQIHRAALRRFRLVFGS